MNVIVSPTVSKVTVTPTGVVVQSTPINVTTIATPGGSSGELQFNSAGAFGGAAQVTYSPTGTLVTVSAGANADLPLLVNAATVFQAGNLTEWRTADDVTQSWVDAGGYLHTRDGSGLANLDPANISAGTAAINISGNAATATVASTATNGVVTTGSYNDPAWITGLAGSKVTGNIGGNAANVTGTVAIAHGGTGQTTAQAGLNALLPSQTGATNKVLQSDGTNAVWHALTSADVGLGNVENTALSTWAGSTALTTLGTIATGTWNGTAVDIAHGGTGQVTAAAALTALLPSQTGANGKVLQSNGTAASWQTVVTAPGGSSGQVQYNASGSFAGAVGLTYATSGALVTITAQAVADVPLTVKGAASQTGDLQQWLKSDGTVVFSVQKDGTIAAKGGQNILSYPFNGGWLFGGVLYLQSGAPSQILTNSVGVFGWTNSTTNPLATPDTGLARSSAGVVTVTNGSAGSGSLLLQAATLSTVPLAVKGAASQSGHLQEWQNSTGTPLAYVSAAGNVSVADGNATSPGLSFTGSPNLGFFNNAGIQLVAVTEGVVRGLFNSQGVRMDPGLQFCWTGTSPPSGGSLDTGLARTAAGIVKLTDGGSGGGLLNLLPVTAPGTPASGFYLYVDSADSKLKCKGSSGTVTILGNP